MKIYKLTNTRLLKRYSYALFTLILLLFCSSSFALTDTLTISFNDVTLAEAIKEIEKKSGYSFAYQSGILPSDYRITKSFKNTFIDEILTYILKGTGITFYKLDDQIIIKKKSKLKKYTISGYLKNSETGELLVNANVYDKTNYIGDITNNKGHYSLTLKEGVYTIVYSYTGMDPIQKQIVLDTNKEVHLSLEPNLEIQEVVIQGNDKPALVERDGQLGKMNISAEEMLELPIIMAEADIVKSLQLLPGIQSGAEGNGALYVRGGGPLQNLFLLDGVPIYNCYHLLGLFSVFNSDIIDNVKVYKGGFSSKHGGRLSSVLDIKSKDGNYEKIKGKVSVGLISSKLSLEGPLIKDKTSFNLAGRLGYYNIYGEILPKKIGGSNDIKDYNFNDINFKITHKLSNDSKLYASIYSGKDKGEKRSTYEESYFEKYSYSQNRDGQDWTNMLGAVGWKGKLSKKINAHAQVSFSNYEYNGYRKDSSYHHSLQDTTNSFQMSNLKNEVFHTQLSSDFQYEINPKIKINLGYQFKQINLKSDNFLRDNFTARHSDIYDNNNDTITSYYNHKTTEHSPYIEAEVNVTPKLGLTSGAHITLYKTDGYTMNQIQPRFTANYEFYRDFILKGGYSNMVQHIHHLGATKIKMASDLIVAAVDKAPSETAHHFSLGISILKFKHLKLHIDTYYKKMDNLINFKQGSSYFKDSNNWIDKIVVGTGDAKGVEFLVEKPLGKLSGWIGYSLAKVNRKFDGINNGKSFAFRYEHMHHLNIVTNYKFSTKWSLSTNWLYHSGNRETIPNLMYWSTNIYHDTKMGIDKYGEATKVMINEKNAYKNPDYHRLDLSLNYKRKNRIGTSTWCLSVYNIYSRPNVYNTTYSENYAHIIGNIGYYLRDKNEHSFFEIIPSLSYSLSF